MGGGREKVSNTQCLHSPNLLTADQGTASLGRDKANVVSLVNSENSQPESAIWGLQEAPGCKRTPPAQQSPKLGARHAAQGVFLEADKVPPLAPSTSLSARRLATSESLPTILRAGNSSSTSTQPKGIVFSSGFHSGPPEGRALSVRLSGKPHSSFVRWAPSPWLTGKPRLRKVRILNTHDRGGHRNETHVSASCEHTLCVCTCI